MQEQCAAWEQGTLWIVDTTDQQPCIWENHTIPSEQPCFRLSTTPDKHHVYCCADHLIELFETLGAFDANTKFPLVPLSERSFDGVIYSKLQADFMPCFVCDTSIEKEEQFVFLSCACHGTSETGFSHEGIAMHASCTTAFGNEVENVLDTVGNHADAFLDSFL